MRAESVLLVDQLGPVTVPPPIGRHHVSSKLNKRDDDAAANTHETHSASPLDDAPQMTAESLLAAIVAGSDDAIVSKDLNGRILTWNEGARRIFGWSEEEAVGSSIELIIPPELRTEEQKILARLRRGEKIDHFETKRVTKDGRKVDISLTVSPIRDAEGCVIGASKVARDVTERRLAERALRESNRRKDMFLAMLSHELRGPLAAIRTAGELVRVHADNVPGLKQPARVLERQAAHMAKLLDGLLDISRISTGKLSIARSDVDLGALVRDVVADHRLLASDRGVDLQLRDADEPMGIYADPARLTQIITNLINNALKFTPRGGSIIVSAVPDGDICVLEVEDTGIGFEPSTAESLFEPFHQGPQDEARTEGGLGLGLALARRLSELHQGTLEATSAGPGKGAKFTLRLPLREAAPRTSPPRPSRSTSGVRVLLIEDNEDSAEMLRQLLSLSGHDVHVAFTGEEGIVMARNQEPDVILCDIGLPHGVTGLDVARALRSDDRTAKVHLVAISGYGRPEDRRSATEAGFDEHLTKPVNLDQLARILAGRGDSGSASSLS